MHIAAAGDHLAVKFYPDTGFAADQLDRPGIHAAQGRGVDGQLRLGRRIGGAGSRLEGLGVDVIGTGNDRQVLGLDLSVDLGRAGDDFELVDVTGIQAGAFDGHA
uniref:hypothetical protein n=1 Tax=Pseudomonas marginalis TaxID=298 RepID=UPI0035CB6964